MMKTHLLGNEHQWIIETHYPDMEEFDFHWDKKVFPSETREETSVIKQVRIEDHNGIFIQMLF